MSDKPDCNILTDTTDVCPRHGCSHAPMTGLTELLEGLKDTKTIVNLGGWSGTAHEAAFEELRRRGPDLARQVLALQEENARLRGKRRKADRKRRARKRFAARATLTSGDK